MGHLPNIHFIYKQDAVIDPEAAILGCSPTRNDLGDKNGRVVTDVRVVSATCDAEAQT